ncbi:hypothetical protein ACFLIM_05275 [Nonomuraea sp. M3C6]|uniref:Uncharacterized protein n=1 Tax=Nonomuraea marmarensis TaxID=3351344 RepID=A0ABW7A8G1_9ACTN
MKRLRQVGRPEGRRVITLVTMIEQWTSEDERELQARCASFRIAKLALDHRHEADKEDEADPAA